MIYHQDTASSLVNLSSFLYTISLQTFVIISYYHLLIYRVYFFRFHLSIYGYHIVLSPVHLSSSYSTFTCQSIFIILYFHLWIYRHHIVTSLVNLFSSYCVFTCESFVIILRFHFSFFLHYFVLSPFQSIIIILLCLCSINQHHNVLSLVNLSSSCCGITYQSIFIIVLSLVNLSFIILRHHLSIYRYHFALSLVNLLWSHTIITCQSIVIILRFHL